MTCYTFTFGGKKKKRGEKLNEMIGSVKMKNECKKDRPVEEIHIPVMKRCHEVFRKHLVVNIRVV